MPCRISSFKLRWNSIWLRNAYWAAAGRYPGFRTVMTRTRVTPEPEIQNQNPAAQTKQEDAARSAITARGFCNLCYL